MEHAKHRGQYVDPSDSKVIFGDYFDEWMARQQLRPSSIVTLRSMFKNQILPTFGGRPIGSLRRSEIEAWSAKLPVSRAYARQATQYLSTVLESAVLDGRLAANPARAANRPAADAEPVTPYTTVELDRLRAAAPAWFRVALTLGAGVGLRQGEACGLTVDRVDWLRREAKVDRQLVTPSKGEATFGPPKSKRSYRTVPLADVVVKSLASHVEQHGEGDHGVILHGVDGRPVNASRFGWTWRQTRKAAGMPAARFHDTRHTFASVLLSGGVSVAAAAEYLGHSPAVLLSTYAHLLPADHDRARSVVEAAFRADAEVTDPSQREDVL
ncbi:MAG: site-specific integrase [Actinomycetota bacterium]|nr:site-specific integrase [Acidimicrobiia bacterium]MDQ3293141.1 site-specific integrase [Actinomycetota bacterium]